MVCASTKRDALICSFLRLAAHISRDFRHWSLGADDLSQVALISVIAAVDGFDPNRGLTLAEYVALKIRWACALAVRRAVRANRDREDADLAHATYFEG